MPSTSSFFTGTRLRASFPRLGRRHLLSSAPINAFRIFSVLIVVSSSTSAFAEVRTVGLRYASDDGCQFSSVQAAIDDLPADGNLHQVLLEDGQYFDSDASIEVAGKRIDVETRFEKRSGCARPAVERAVLSSIATPLAKGRVVVVENGAYLGLKDVELSGPERGAIYVSGGSVKLSGVTIHESHSPERSEPGGAILNIGGKVTIEDSELFDNSSAGNGGAIYCAGGDGPGEDDPDILLQGNVDFFSNAALDGSGGAVYLAHSCRLIALQDSSDFIVFASNTASADGGAIGTGSAPSPEKRNHVILKTDSLLRDNRAGRDGGAISLRANSRFDGVGHEELRFERNHAGRFGGALYSAQSSASAQTEDANFLSNRASRHGGAVAVMAGRVVLTSLCGESSRLSGRYCARLRGNYIDEAADDETQRGGALYVGESGELRVVRNAISETRGPKTSSANGGSGGVVAFVEGGGLLEVEANLVFDHVGGSGADSNLFQFDGGVGIFSFNTMVDAVSFGGVVMVGEQASVAMVGNIMAGNGGGVIGPGILTGTCNNAQLGSAPAPMDPGFETDPDRRYSLRADSAMIGRGLTCDERRLPADFAFPVYDLMGNRRVTDSESPMEIDLGALEYVQSKRIFSSSFEFPR